MNETPPLRIDLRLVLETLADGLAVLMVGVAAFNLSPPESVAVPLVITVLLVMTRRLLGQKTNAIASSLTAQRDGLIAENTVLAAEVTPTVRKAAAEAGAALNPAKPAEPPFTPAP